MPKTMATDAILPKRATRTSFQRRTKIAKKMKELRIAKGLSIDAAAKRGGMSRWTWERWERAQSSIPTERIADIDRVLVANVGDGSGVTTFSKAISSYLAAA